MDRQPGLSVRLKLTLSYAGFLMLAGVLLLATVWVFLLRYVPDGVLIAPTAAPTPAAAVVSSPPPLPHQEGARGSSGCGPVSLPSAGAVAGGEVDGQPCSSPAPPYIPNRSDLQRAFAPRAAAALAFLLVFGVVGGWLLAGRMLTPLSRITDATRMAATGSLSHRIRLPGRGDELRELADAFDAMLARLEAHVAEQRRFAANASHELRTPLAIMRTLLDVARDDPSGTTGELVERLRAVNTRAIELTEALLLLSRADRRSFIREQVDLSLIVEEATETLLPLAEQRGLTIETGGDVTPAIGSPALLLQVTTNLVHNAIVHNLPERGSVWVTTSAHPQCVVLTVENTGEPLAPQLVSTLVEPFRRGAERVRTEHAGVGLGLAIVDSITQAHDGTLTITPRAAGGLCVTVQLPAAPLCTGR